MKFCYHDESVDGCPMCERDALKAKLAEVVDGCCAQSGAGRGDCEHFVGLPGNSIPGQHDGGDDTLDHRGKPNGWCQRCWDLIKLAEQRNATQAMVIEASATNEMLEEQRRLAVEAFTQTVATIDNILEPVRDWYDGDGERTDSAAMLRDAISDLQDDRATIERLEAEKKDDFATIAKQAEAIGRLRDGIGLFLGGGYEDLGQDDKCRHGSFGYEGCGQCDGDYFESVLAAAKGPTDGH